MKQLLIILLALSCGMASLDAVAQGFSSLSPSGMLHYQSTNNHAGGLIACTVVSVLQSLVVFLLYLVPGKIVSKLHPAVGLAQTRERLLKLKQLVTVVLGVVFHVDFC